MTTFRRTLACLALVAGCVPLLHAAGPEWQQTTREDIRETHPLGIMGAVELVHVEQVGRSYPARIDTGATTSSIDAQNIGTFERDGEDWVRFDIPPRPLDRSFEPGEDEWPEGARPGPRTCERPVVERIEIEHSEGPNDERYVVALDIVIGDNRLAGEFTLNDRAEFEYGVLIGRNLIAGNALVDPARERVHGRPQIDAAARLLEEASASPGYRVHMDEGNGGPE